MSKYIKLFNTHSQYESYTADTETFIKPNVSFCLDTPNEVHYNPTVPQHDYSQDYFTIVSLSDNNTIKLKTTNYNYAKTIFVSTDNGETWLEKSSSPYSSDSITLNSNQKLLIKGNNDYYGDITDSVCNKFTATSSFYVEGNIMSLVYGDNYQGQVSFTNSNKYVFKYLFSGCTTIVSAENLILPATTLAPKCYSGMFNGCTSLTTAPTLPATTLASDCYSSMFYGCRSLTTAPSLPATTLASNCYSNMLQNCTNLNSITCLATDISASYCTNFWVNGVSSSGTFTKAASMNDWTIGNHGIPSNWTVVDAS